MEPTAQVWAPSDSLINDYTSEWRKRPVNLLKLISSFVSQLSIGDELTRVSLPTEICHPFSILEVLSHRELSCVNVLFEINKCNDDPYQRFLCVVRWLISMLQSEQMEKKPFNPVIGEQHLAWIEHSAENWTEYVSEQVSHHPPISAFFMRNKKEKIALTSNLQFSVHFGGNYATVLGSGPVELRTAFETYKMNKISPNMMIRNVVWGTKYFMWDGDVEMECPESGYKVEFSLSEVDPETNKLVGRILKLTKSQGENGEEKHDEEELLILGGVTGKKTEMWKPNDEDNKEELFNFDHFVHPKISYMPVECQVRMDSMKLWKSVADPIIADDMWTADMAKKKIEQAQRLREKERERLGQEYKGVYFEHKEQEDATKLWVFNEKETLCNAFLSKLAAQAKLEDEEIARMEEEIARRRAESGETDEPTDGSDPGCIIS